MQTTKQIGFSPEHTAIIDRWCRSYPYRKSIGFALIKANPEENARLQEMLAAGHTEKEVYAKGYYHRMSVIGDVEKKASLLTPRGLRKIESKRVDGGYQCYLCTHVAPSRQHLAAHVRYTHPGQSRTAQMRARWASHTGRKKYTKRGTNNVVNAAWLTVTVTNSELVNQFVIIREDGTVVRAKLVNYCPHCGGSLQAHNAAANI